MGIFSSLKFILCRTIFRNETVFRNKGADFSKSMRNRFLGPGDIYTNITNMVHRFNFCSLYTYFESSTYFSSYSLIPQAYWCTVFIFSKNSAATLMKFRSFWQAYNDPRQKIDFQPLTIGVTLPHYHNMEIIFLGES